MAGRLGWALVGVVCASLVPALSGSAASGAYPVSYAKARQLVLQRVVKPGSLAKGDHLVAFRLAKPLRPGQRVRPYRGRGRGVRIQTGPHWFFWVDDEPHAEFAHPNRYVFVNARTGRVTVFRQEWWPLVDGRAPWGAARSYWNARNWAFSTLKKQAPPPAPPTSPPPEPAVTESTPECALIVQGSGGHFGHNAAGMESALKALGFTTVTLRPPDNEPEDLERAVEELELAGCRNLMLYIASHGNKQAVVDMGGSTYSAERLRNLMKRFPKLTFKVVVQACYSGSWIPVLGDAPEIVVTSSTKTEVSYGADSDDRWPETQDPNPDDEGSEFTSGLVEDLEAIAESPQLQQRALLCAAGVNPPTGVPVPLLVCKLRIAFESAVEKDEDALAGKTHPQLHEP